MIVKKKYYSNEIVTQINANCKISQVPFPAVSICNFNVASLKDTQNIKRLLAAHNQSEVEIMQFFRTLYMLTHFSVEVHSIGNFTNIMKILKNHYYTMDSIMEEVHQKCEDLLVHCSFNTKEKKCSDLFTMIKTSEGFCCAFNYAGTIDDAYSKFDEDFEYYDGDADDDEFSSRIIANSKSGRQKILFTDDGAFKRHTAGRTSHQAPENLTSPSSDYPLRTP
ncbi:hypothetical protein evm_010311 [Chilo suppressalis]|nr:hypothetical protein evm_010311 [Chilo suppressalis]